MSIDVVPIGDVVLPDDLVAPLGGEDCCGEIWLAPIAHVAAAAFGIAPLVSPCCGRRFGVRDLGEVKFVSRADWDAASDDAPPAEYRVGHAFNVGGEVPMPACAAECSVVVRGLLAEMGVDAHVSHLPPLISPLYKPLDMSCPHGVVWYTQPTSEQMAKWAEDGVE